MPPQNSQPQVPNYNFILQDSPKPKRRFRLPLPPMPKPLAISVVAVVGLFLIIIIYSLLTGGGDKTSGFAGIAARAQEISRVSELVNQASDDPTVKSLALTSETTMKSAVAQIQSYLTKNGAGKISPATLATYKKTTTDTEVTSADQNNTLASYYKSYLKDALATYQTGIQTTYDSASSKAKPVLSGIYQSAQTLSTGL